MELPVVELVRLSKLVFCRWWSQKGKLSWMEWQWQWVPWTAHLLWAPCASHLPGRQVDTAHVYMNSIELISEEHQIGKIIISFSLNN